MEIVIKTVLPQIITQCAGTQDIIKKFASCDPCGRKRGLKTVAFLLRLSIYLTTKKTDTFYYIELSQYDYFNNKTLESNLRKNIFIKQRT